MWAAFKGGVVLEADPKGNFIWEYKHPDHHHDGRRLRNDNTILLASVFRAFRYAPEEVPWL